MDLVLSASLTCSESKEWWWTSRFVKLKSHGFVAFAKKNIIRVTYLIFVIFFTLTHFES